MKWNARAQSLERQRRLESFVYAGHSSRAYIPADLGLADVVMKECKALCTDVVIKGCKAICADCAHEICSELEERILMILKDPHHSHLFQTAVSVLHTGVHHICFVQGTME